MPGTLRAGYDKTRSPAFHLDHGGRIIISAETSVRPLPGGWVDGRQAGRQKRAEPAPAEASASQTYRALVGASHTDRAGHPVRDRA
ncbi:hypothetical protein Aau02nite_04850 [Amorphoplanes auranticolor]|uniref:Uncharacterized protein n=1 Tax=Actinoplanes auranticolor TaxID=47988 RepID=A0A919VIA8_9ACTN|nr:hypothetical protein Aau02nite_04850 [Actinoplanes auranticolor]